MKRAEGVSLDEELDINNMENIGTQTLVFVLTELALELERRMSEEKTTVN